MINVKNSLEKLFTPCGVPKLKDDKLTYVDFHIIDGCNLNCARCYKFSPLCKDIGLVDKDSFTKDIIQLSKIEPNLLGISLIGGEPLISPDIEFYMEKTRELFPNTDITIITNGINIPKMSDNFFNLVKNNRIYISISKYFDDSFYEKINKKLEEKNCSDFVVYSQFKEIGSTLFLQMELDEYGKQDELKNWELCSSKNGCVLLKDGKLWSCPNLCTKYILNNYFNTNLIDFEEDGISIYNNNYKDIITHLKKPKKGCRYCTEDIYKCMYFPKPTEYKKSEWIREEK